MKWQNALGLFKRFNVENKMKLFGEVGGFDVSIIVCGEDFSSNLAHKDFRYCTCEFQMIIFVWIQDSLLFHIYCVRGELSRSVSPPRVGALSWELAVETPPVYTHQKLFLFLFFICHRQTQILLALGYYCH